MYKYAGQFLAANPDLGVRASQQHVPVPPPWAVVAFRRGRDNQRRERIYRRVWAFEREDHARRAWLVMSGTAWHIGGLVRDGAPIATRSWANAPVTDVVAEWIGTRRGVNRHADPWMASGYMVREGGGPETYMEAGR